jgi:hypothetical protein
MKICQYNHRKNVYLQPPVILEVLLGEKYTWNQDISQLKHVKCFGDLFE